MPGRRWRLLQAALLAGGIALLLVSSTFLLVGGWDEAPPPSVALRAEPSAELGPEPQGDAESTPEAPAVEQEGTLDVGPALARVDADALSGGLARLVVALHPTSTPTPTPTSTPIPTPTPTLIPAPEQPAAPPQPVETPQSGPAAPPAAPTESAPPAPTPTPQSPRDGGDCPTASMSGFALALFNAINIERTQRELPALAVHGCVVYVAQLRSDDMANRGYFSHTSPEGETAFSLMDQYGVSYGWAGENLARNNYPDDQTVEVAIRDLMASEGHRANILNGNFTHLGVGMAVDGAGMKYYAMVFIGPP